MERLRPEQSPEVLTHKAKEIVSQLGYTDKPVDSAGDFNYDTDFVKYVEKNDKPHARWDEVLAGRPSPLQYSYRQSAQYMLALDFHNLMLVPGIVTDDDPPPILSGMVNLVLDPRGRLTYFQAIPPQMEESADACAGG